MPRWLHKKLLNQAKKKGSGLTKRKQGRTVLTGRGRAYVYGTLAKHEGAK